MPLNIMHNYYHAAIIKGLGGALIISTIRYLQLFCTEIFVKLQMKMFNSSLSPALVSVLSLPQLMLMSIDVVVELENL